MLGQIFEGTYTIEAADWCNNNNCYIEEIEPLEDGTRRFEIREVKPYVETEEEKAQRIALLKLRRGDVFRGLLQAKGITKVQIETMIEAMPEETDEEVMAKELARIDFEDAIEFFRGNPLVDTIGQALGITKEQLDEFFATNDYTKLG